MQTINHHYFFSVNKLIVTDECNTFPNKLRQFVSVNQYLTKSLRSVQLVKSGLCSCIAFLYLFLLLVLRKIIINTLFVMQLNTAASKEHST